MDNQSQFVENGWYMNGLLFVIIIMVNELTTVIIDKDDDDGFGMVCENMIRGDGFFVA